jgi:hypothetical protein
MYKKERKLLKVLTHEASNFFDITNRHATILEVNEI